LERKTLAIFLLVAYGWQCSAQSFSATIGLSAPFFAIPGICFMVENRIPITLGSSVAISANWMPFSTSAGSGVVADAQFRFYTTRKRSAPIEAPLFGFFMGPSLSFGAVGFGRIYEGNGQIAVGGAIVGNRFRAGYSGVFIEPILGVQYGLYQRAGDYTRTYYRIVPWLTAGVGLGIAK
jgi:hypothetical protein